jgi:hypothetical protein
MGLPHVIFVATRLPRRDLPPEVADPSWPVARQSRNCMTNQIGITRPAPAAPLARP